MKLFKLMFLVFISLAVCLVTNAAAENRAGAVSVSPLIGGYIFDDDQSINSDPAYGIVLGYNITERIGIEGAFNYVDTDTRSAGTKSSVAAYVYRLEGLYHFMADKDVLPYIAVGGGAITLDVDGSDKDTDFLADYGAGIKYFLTDSLAFRVGVRHIISFDDTYNNILYKVGFSYLIGGKTKAPPMPTDTDGDGIADDMDKCPTTPAGVQVDGSGCPMDADRDGIPDYKDKCANTPAGVKVDALGCPMDADGDGVPDSRDKCPDTPKGISVGSSGCPIDSDADGVVDKTDKCPGTPAGASVDNVGCPTDGDRDGVADYLDECPGTLMDIKVDAKGCPVPIKEKVSIELNVEFASNSSVVRNAYHEPIQKVVNFLKTYPDTSAVIEGHTDDSGNDENNLKLSQQRAENVMQHIVENRIHPSRVKAVGYGETRPIADNSTKEGRQKNRRVVAVISTIIEKMP